MALEDDDNGPAELPAVAVLLPAVAELAPLNRIRVETALSRFPVHRLSKKGSVVIDVLNDLADFKWRVTYNAGFGEPGPLAYKLDTLIVNRHLDEAPRPLPDAIRIGSLAEICRELGLSSGKSTQDIKRALHQNASAYIVAKIRYRTRRGLERWKEIGYSRYGVVFTGDELPDGTVADAVYILPNTWFREILNEVEVRPLDYEYLKELSPGPQRFYELLSFQVYGAIASGRPRARLAYSDYCQCAPQMRYTDWPLARKQMHKLHLPHLHSGYIAKVDFVDATDRHGRADWDMLYTPGPKARAEFEAFNRRADDRGERRPILLAPLGGSAVASVSKQAALPFGDAPPDPELVAMLVERGIDTRTAAKLLTATVPGQDVRRQIAYADERIAKDTRIDSPTGYLVDVLRRNRPVPRTFQTSRPRAAHSAADNPARTAALERQYLAARAAAYDRVLAELPETEQLLDTERAAARAEYATVPVSPEMIERIARGSVLRRLEADGRFTFPALEAWSATARTTG